MNMMSARTLLGRASALAWYALATLPLPAASQSIVADAIVCETEEPLSLLAADNLAGQPGSVVLKRVAATIKLNELAAQFHQTMGALAQREQGIYRDTRTPDRGATSSRIAGAKTEQSAAIDASTKHAEFMRRCAATGPAAQPATTVEQRPVSGSSRIRTMFRGKEVELWTVDFYLRPH